MFVPYHSLQLLEKFFSFSCSLLQRLSQSGGVLNPDNSHFLVPRALEHWTVRFAFLEHLEHWWRREEKVSAQVASQSASQSRPSHMNHCSIIITLSWFPFCSFSSSHGFLWSLWVSKVPQSTNLTIIPMWYIKTDSSSFWTVGKFSLKPKCAIYFWCEEIMSESLGITVKPTENQ